MAIAALAAAGVGAAVAQSGGDGPRPLRPDAQWTTVFKPPAGVGIEGLAAGRRGDLYAPGRAPAGSPCPVFRIRDGASAVVGNLAAPCNPAGLTLGPDGRLYITNSDHIEVLRPDAAAPPTAALYASGTPGANGVAFDRDGGLWVSDGGTAQGRVWRIGARDRVATEMFRIQPLANDVVPGGVGRDVRGLPPGTITITETSRQASNTLGSQHLVANGVAFGRDGTLYVADTARGAIWRVYLDGHGRVRSPMGCDSTFTANTLCLDAVWVQHPYLEGADGIVLDDDDTIYVAANERNAVTVVTRKGDVREYFRNAPAATRLRNEGPLEFPTSPVLVGGKLCLTSSDGARRDNFPNAPGEGPKVSCVG
jgi:sugar lactone lactonase YvrE